MESNGSVDAAIILNKIEEHKKAIIYRFFGEVDALEVNQIEIDNDNENIHVIISFYQGGKILYRDSSMHLEQCFLRYLSWFNNTIMKNTPLYCKKILSYSDCSFIEYLEEKKPKTEGHKEDLYYRLGCIIAILSSLNVVIVGEDDIIDIEDNLVIKNIESMIKKDPFFNINIVKEKRLLENAKAYCPLEYWNKMEDGYQVVLQYIKENEEDMWSLIKVCFQVKEIGEIC